jgi:hypothetical protein
MMKRRINSQTAPDARPPMVLPMRRAAVAAAGLLISAAALAGCGREIAGAGPGAAGAAPSNANATASLAVAANSGCVEATPIVKGALGVLTRLQRKAVTPAQARSSLAAEVAQLERLARATPDDALQESLSNVYDAFTAFQAVMQNPSEPAYPSTFFNLRGTLAGFGRTCSVVDNSVASGAAGGAEAYANTKLTRSATAHGAPWSLQVTNTATSPAMAGFTVAPSSVSPTLKGSVQIGLWARALTGAPTVTLRVRELSGSTVVGTQQVTMKLDSTFRFHYLTYTVMLPGASRLSVTVAAAGLHTQDAFFVDDITIVRD